MTRTTFLSLTAAVAVVLAAGCGDDGGSSIADAARPIDAVPPDAPARETIMENVLLEPQELAEGIMTGGPDDLAVITLSAPVPELDWNIHGHAGGGTQVVYEELNKMNVTYTFVPTAETDWWLLVRNSGPTDMTISVKVELYGEMRWRWE